MYFVYILKCENGSLYTGITTDLCRRYEEHCGKGGKGAKYTSAFKPMGFVAAWSAQDKSASSKLEYAIKTLTRAQKEALIEENTSAKIDLSPYTRLQITKSGEIINNSKETLEQEMKKTENSDFGRMLSYCDALSKNNDRTWFHENHKWYENAKSDYEELLELMRFWVSDAAPALSADVMYMRVKDWMYRIPRDARIKNGKPPYNPSFRAYVSADRRSWQPIGYFLRIAPGDSCLGTGLWCEDTNKMNIIRDYIMENADELYDILDENDLTIVGDSLKTMPKGYAPGCDGAEFIKFKNWSVIFSIPDEKLTTFDEFGELVRNLIRRMEPLRQYLLRACGSGRTRKQELEDFYN